MPYYQVKAIDTSGRAVTRTIEADNDIQLLSFLDFLNLTPIKISKRPEFLGRIQTLLHFRKVKRKELIDMFENMHLLIKSGVPLGAGIWDMAEDMDNPALRDMLHDIAYRVQSGLSFSSAMAKYERILGAIAVNLIKIGEETGSLDRVFKDIADHYARIEDFKAKVKQAMIYPSFAVGTIFLALIFWLVFVLPKLGELFAGLNVQLPTITLVVMNVSKLIQKYILYMVAFLVISVILFNVARIKSERFRYVTDKMFLRVPIFSMILYNFNYAFFSEYMRLLVTTGVPLIDAFDILRDSFNNRVFKRAIASMKDFVSEGGSISGAMKRTKLFPSLMVRMISVGEETGGLDNQLEYLSEYYYNKLDYITQNIAKIIEPVIIVTVGLMMAVIMISLLLPIYDLISQIGRGF
jgi:type II secretory pathway component PulF